MTRTMTTVMRTAAVLTIAGLAAAATPAAQQDHRRPPDVDHYARLSNLAAGPADDRLDPLRFPLDKWGDLYAWRLLQPYYVTVKVPAFRQLIPPANGSAQTRAELDYLLALQASRTPEDQAWCERLAAVYYHPLIVNPADPRFAANRENLFFVGRGLGGWFSARTLPRTAELLARVHHDAAIHMVELKLAYARPRPHHLEPRLRAQDERIPHGSYPSGHSFMSHVNAELLARLAPERRDALVASARTMAWSRELLGVHYPSDSEAGRLLAGDFVRLLFENAAFRGAFAKVQQEWATVAPRS